MHRSALLPNFDQTCAQIVATQMETNTQFIANTSPVSIEKTSDDSQYLVKWQKKSNSSTDSGTASTATDNGDSSGDSSGDTNSDESEGIFDMVMSAVGREADVRMLGLDKTGGVLLDKDTYQIITDDQARTNIKHM